MIRITGPVATELQRTMEKGQPRPNPIIAKLKPGDVFHAEVVSNQDGALVLKLEDGSRIYAQRDLPLLALPGEPVALRMVGRSGAQVMVELASLESQLENIDLNELARSLGLSPGRLTELVLSELIKNGVNPTRDMAERALSGIRRNPALTAEKAAFLAANNVPINPGSVSMLEGFLNSQSLIDVKLTRLLSILENYDIPEAAAFAEPNPAEGASATVSAEQPSPEGAAVDGQTLQTVEPENGAAPASPQAILPQDQPIPAPQQTGIPAGEVLPAQPQAEVPADEPAASLPPQTEVPTGPAEARTAAAEFPVSGNQERPDAAGTPGNAAQNAPLAGDIYPDAAVYGEGADPASPAGGDAPNALKGQAQTSEASALPLSGDSYEAASSSPSEAESVPTAPFSRSAAAYREAGIDELKSMIDRVFSRIDHATARLLPRNLEWSRVLKNVASLLETVRGRAHLLNDAQRAAALSVAEEVEVSLRFLENLNVSSTVIQLPVILNGNPVTAELYVFSEGKGKRKIDPENATAFISLSTENLDRVEVFVRLIGSNAELDFRLSGEDAVSLFQANAELLSDMLSACGYRISRLSFARADRKLNLFDAREEYRTQERFYSIDVKV